jgi:transposase-like protein
MSQDPKAPDGGLPNPIPRDLAEQIVLHVDGVSRDGSTWFRCHCCARDFLTAKPQDPRRDVGYGTCEGCHKTWLHRRATPAERAAADERFERYA